MKEGDIHPGEGIGEEAVFAETLQEGATLQQDVTLKRQVGLPVDQDLLNQETKVGVLGIVLGKRQKEAGLAEVGSFQKTAFSEVALKQNRPVSFE